MSRVNSLGSNPRQAIAYLKQAFGNIKEPGAGDLYAKYDLLRQIYFEDSGDCTKGLLYADSMLDVLQPYAKERAYNLRYAQAHFYKGDILFKLRRFNEAYLEFYEGKVSVLPSFDRCDLHLFLFNYYRRLADISYGKGLFLDAAKWHKISLAEFNGCTPDTNEYYLVQGSLDNIALSYTLAGKPDSAQQYYGKALKLLASVKPTSGKQRAEIEIARGVVLGNQGTVYYKEGKFAMAIQNLKQSIAINSRPGYDTKDAMLTRIKLAELYVKTKQLAEAKDLVSQVNAYPDSMWEALQKLRVIALNANYAIAVGDEARANGLFQQYIDENKKYQGANKELMSADFSKEFELLKRRYDWQELEKRDQLKDIYLCGAITFSLMAMVIIYLMLKSSRETKANARQSALYNRQLEATLKALEKSNREHSQLLGVVAHDLKNPINAIYGISAIMTEEENRTTEDMEMLELIKVSSMNLNALIHDLLAARINEEPDDNQKAPASLLALLQESVALLQYRAEQKKQHIMLGENPDYQVYINRHRVWRVINNLIVNAIKFSPEQTTITITWELAGEEVVVCVRDEGIGIPDELKDKIFHLATDAKRPGTAGEATFGLGLFISKQIIEDQGGKIWLESQVGQGTAFYFTLPLAENVG